MSKKCILPGLKATCCGNVPATIICGDEDCVLLIRHDQFNTVVVGNFPSLSDDGRLVWSAGAYFTPYGGYTLEAALYDALAHMMNKPE